MDIITPKTLIRLFGSLSLYDSPVQKNLRWDCDSKKADEICNFNRHYAEFSGYFETRHKFMEEALASTGPMQFFDSNTGKLLFTAPVGRTMDQFLAESSAHGWPSFRDPEVRDFSQKVMERDGLWSDYYCLFTRVCVFRCIGKMCEFFLMERL